MSKEKTVEDITNNINILKEINNNTDLGKYYLSLIDIKSRDNMLAEKIRNANSYGEKRFYERKRMRNLIDRGLKYPRLYAYDSIYGG